jgi:hypothetical protein
MTASKSTFVAWVSSGTAACIERSDQGFRWTLGAEVGPWAQSQEDAMEGLAKKIEFNVRTENE